MRHIVFIFLISALIFSCSKNQNDPLEPDNNSVTLTVPVSAMETYYISLDEQKEVEVTDMLLESNWDIVIDNLTRVRLNGGSTAAGDVFAMKVEGQNYADVTAAIDGIYHADTQDEFAIGEGWYFYDITTHTVNPLDHFYIVRGSDGGYYKFQITDAVFPSRTDGELKIDIQKIDDPAMPEFPVTEGRVQYYRFPLSTMTAKYFSFSAGGTVEVADESTSMGWDFKSEYLTISLNGGDSGPGQAAGILVENSEFDSVLTAPASGYTVDSSSEGAFIGDNWYTYDFMTHIVSVNPYVYIMKTAEGHYAKLEFVQTDFSSQDEGIALIRFEYITGTNEF